MSHRKWSEIRAKAAPETLEAAAGITASLRLRELCEPRRLNQTEVADETVSGFPPAT